MFLSLIMPLARVSHERPCAEVATIRGSEKLQALQDQMSLFLFDREKISTEIDSVNNSSSDNDWCFATNKIFSTAPLGTPFRIDVDLSRIRSNYFDTEKSIKIQAVYNTLNAAEEKELSKYKFALYKFNPYLGKKDQMTWCKPLTKFGGGNPSLEIDLSKINVTPSDEFKATVRNNYFENTPKTEAYAILVFKEEEVADGKFDYLIIYE